MPRAVWVLLVASFLISFRSDHRQRVRRYGRNDTIVAYERHLVAFVILPIAPLCIARWLLPDPWLAAVLGLSVIWWIAGGRVLRRYWLRRIAARSATPE